MNLTFPLWVVLLALVVGDLAGFATAALVVAAERDMPPHPFIVDGEWDDDEVAAAILADHHDARTPG